MSRRIAQFETSGGALIGLHQGDLTRESLDAIVNAANSRLAHGGGVARAIVRRGGSIIQRQSDELVARQGEVPAGKAVWTGAGALKARGVIHGVGPIWGEGDEPRKLREAALSAFMVAVEHDCSAIALPAISSGIFGFPKPLCAEILIQAAIDFLDSHGEDSLREIRFTIIDDETIEIFKDEFLARFGQSCLSQ